MVHQPASNSKKKITAAKEIIRPHSKIPHEDMDWVLEQSPAVIRLFFESWRHESFGKQQRLLKTKLQGDNLRKTMRLLENNGFFKYQAVTELINGRYKIIQWKIENLHGYYYQQEQERKVLNAGGYQTFLKSDYWQQVRQLVIARDVCCQYCNSANFLQVHHLIYEHHGDELNHLDDLITLCRDCHRIEHDKTL